MNFQPHSDNLEAARKMDSADPLSRLRGEFQLSHPLYFAGHSLGLMPKKVLPYLEEECEAWAKLGVEAHFEGRHPWLPYHENVTQSLARLVGARPQEVVAMNALTVNLHLMMVSFYRPTKQRYKILIENNTFPSDRYVADSQARFHGFDPRDAVVELKPSPGKMTMTPDEIQEQILACGDALALVLFGNCNYLSGQRFDFETITQLAHETGALVGFNLAHGAGNLAMSLHDWSVDFAVWCSYKYLNAGPGGIAGAFVHETHLNKKDLPRFEGWWGHDKKTRFRMPAEFAALPSAEAWQLSNPPIFQLASLRASLELFDEVGMEPKIRKQFVHVIDDLRNPFRVFSEEDRQTPRVRLDIVDMGRHQLDDLRRQIMLATVPFDGLGQPHHCGGFASAHDASFLLVLRRLYICFAAFLHSLHDAFRPSAL